MPVEPPLRKVAEHKRLGASLFHLLRSRPCLHPLHFLESKVCDNRHGRFCQNSIPQLPSHLAAFANLGQLCALHMSYLETHALLLERGNNICLLHFYSVHYFYMAKKLT